MVLRAYVSDICLRKVLVFFMLFLVSSYALRTYRKEHRELRGCAYPAIFNLKLPFYSGACVCAHSRDYSAFQYKVSKEQ